jgi:hypothetical protein
MLLRLYEKAFHCSVQRSAPQSSKSPSKSAETVTIEDVLKSEPEDNEEDKDSYTLSQIPKPDSEKEVKLEAQYEEYNQVFVLQ